MVGETGGALRLRVVVDQRHRAASSARWPIIRTNQIRIPATQRLVVYRVVAAQGFPDQWRIVVTQRLEWCSSTPRPSSRRRRPARGDDAAGPGGGAVLQLRELVGALPAAPGEAASEQGQWMATQREAGGGVIEGDGFVFRSLEQIGLFVRALDDRGVGEQGVAVDALLAGCGPELMAAGAGERLQGIGLRE